MPEDTKAAQSAGKRVDASRHSAWLPRQTEAGLRLRAESGKIADMQAYEKPLPNWLFFPLLALAAVLALVFWQVTLAVIVGLVALVLLVRFVKFVWMADRL